VKSTFVDGLRVTDEATMEVAEMVLSGAINKEIASWITQAGAEADVRGVGLSGKDARLITVEKVTRTARTRTAIERDRRPGLRRRAEAHRPKLIEALIYADEDYIPVVARSASPRTARPTTSTPTPWPAPWPAR
jgi:acetylglutamate kinase